LVICFCCGVLFVLWCCWVVWYWVVVRMVCEFGCFLGCVFVLLVWVRCCFVMGVMVFEFMFLMWLGGKIGLCIL
jgi:hypothetical protein